ncbi:MerR family transcriptional regulator [Nocardioides terrigena]|uniref:MerR family transcriptional regulator n=1 Tax=Nocardioides terrigena TaxID=424797 RepID=UPI000D32762D|nr:MerR family transcriptional regulator [Nocardioides terrigena]
MSTSLSIGELSARTGVTPSTLRIWEERHGFPVPTRLGSGHRRYDEGDAVLVAEVARLRDSGMRLDAAIAAARREAEHQQQVAGGPRTRSVHARLLRREPALPVHRLRKRTLVALSHAIEDEFCARARDAHLFGLFQRAEHFAPARTRWRELALLARTTHVFADFPPGSRDEDDLQLVTLPERSPLLREWAVICDATEAPIALTAWEVPGQVGVPERHRVFEATWTMVPSLVREAARVCADAAAGTPGAEALAEELAAAPTGDRADPELASAFFNRAVAYLDRG